MRLHFVSYHFWLSEDHWAKPHVQANLNSESFWATMVQDHEVGEILATFGQIINFHDYECQNPAPNEKISPNLAKKKKFLRLWMNFVEILNKIRWDTWLNQSEMSSKCILDWCPFIVNV